MGDPIYLRLKKKTDTIVRRMAARRGIKATDMVRLLVQRGIVAIRDKRRGKVYR